MRKPLQNFNWKESRYERPGDRWVCGRHCAGTPCAAGPNPNGTCPEHSESGEASCRPVWSLSFRRRCLALGVTGFSVALCLIIGGGSPSLVSPGQLTAAHGSANMSCADCHAAADGRWMATALDSSTGQQDSQRCLKCHTELDPEPLRAHGLPRDSLTALTADQPKATETHGDLLVNMATLLVDDAAELSLNCNRCHLEHRGRGHDLTAISSARCQTCHAQQFRSFEHGHPEFGAYPYERSGRIQFDHVAHLQKYFHDDALRLMPGVTVSGDCTSCHRADESGSRMLTRGFEVMCAACHQRDIEDRDDPGIPFLALPRVPQQLLESELEFPVGDWPAPPVEPPLSMEPGFQTLLLLDESDGPRSPEARVTRFDDLAATSTEQARQRLLSIKRLFAEVAWHGQSALSDRLPEELRVLAIAEPSIVPTMMHAQQSWFPGLLEERTKTGRVENNNSVPSPRTTPAESVLGGGWYVRQADQTVRYRPIGHADPLVKVWLEAAMEASTESTPQREALDRMLNVLMNPTASGSIETRGPVSSGRCLSCHAVVNDSAAGSRRIYWSSRTAEELVRPFTSFRHAPHTLGDTGASCQTCHALNDGLDLSTRKPQMQTGAEAGPLRSCFAPLSKAACATCHHSNSGLNRCTDCHQYHVRNLSGVGH